MFFNFAQTEWNITNHDLYTTYLWIQIWVFINTQAEKNVKQLVCKGLVSLPQQRKFRASIDWKR